MLVRKKHLVGAGLLALMVTGTAMAQPFEAAPNSAIPAAVIPPAATDFSPANRAGEQDNNAAQMGPTVSRAPSENESIPNPAYQPPTTDSMAPTYSGQPFEQAQQNESFNPSGIWVVKSGMDLREVLYDWDQRAGWTLVWNSEYSYTLQANATFQGDFVNAVTQLFTAIGGVNPPLYPSLYKGNRVLMVKNQPNQ